jgi:hypothetical protein
MRVEAATTLLLVLFSPVVKEARKIQCKRCRRAIVRRDTVLFRILGTHDEKISTLSRADSAEGCRPSTGPEEIA